MILIEDGLKTLNLNHMAIYLMLTPEEISKYGSKLKDLNNYRSLTRRLFRFEVVEKGNTPCEQLPEKLTRSTHSCNVLVHLLTSVRYIYCYGLDTIDLSLEPAQLREELSAFVDEVCNKNIYQLHLLKERNTATSMKAYNAYRDASIVTEVFQRALAKEYFIKKDSVHTTVESKTHTTTMQDSYEIAKEALGENTNGKIEKERSERERPMKKPTISTTIKYVPTGKSVKGGKEIVRLGMEFVINGDVIPILFSSTDQLFLYAVVLLAQLEGIRLKREDFTLNSSTGMKEWLKKKYNAFSFNGIFEEWFDKINNNGPAARMNDAKSKINNKLWAVLSGKYKDAYYFCCLVTENPRHYGSYYNIRIPNSHIRIADDIQKKLN